MHTGGDPERSRCYDAGAGNRMQVAGASATRTGLSCRSHGLLAWLWLPESEARPKASPGQSVWLGLALATKPKSHGFLAQSQSQCNTN